MTTDLPAIPGVSPVLEVPFHPDGSLDEGGFATVVARVLDTGVRSVMFPGFASEFHKLSDAERARLSVILLDRTRERDDVCAIVSIPDHGTVSALDRAREAVEAGADAINVLPPHFLGPSREAVAAHLAAVLDAVAPLPVILQYAPAQTGTALDADGIRELAAARPNLRMVKVESQPPHRLVAALGRGRRPLPAMVGYAGVQLPAALDAGAVGVQPGCSFVEIYQEIWRLHASGDPAAARGLHTRLLPYISTWMQHVELIVAAEKRVSVRRGWFGSDHCRAPGWALDRTELALVDRFVAEFAELLPGVAS
ncbi:dihydrodipicolinate synthase family protein [Streptomyces sp. SID3343]|uniref:dihydrodipicolinate synthase family protein n=1 Tax=Streptomyces sp. SID3343 TaxID=2690260 RepID=UPI001370654F|nr:dihydrodipicolinate synthase family protein [Streptomyces sp. SID3343]MYW02830.1 dihydrodipicolinate synthase family protein [Streptomyces sp. SID3343]